MRLCFAIVFLSAVTADAGMVETLDGRRLAGTVEVRGEAALVRQGDRVETVPLVDAFRVQLVDDAARRPILDLAARTTPVNVTSEHAVALNQSAVDALNGRVGMLRKGDKREGKPRPGLTDARSSSQPSEENGWLSGEVTWDMGSSIPVERRQLDSISIWIRASDSARCDYAGAWAVSSDGENFTEISGTRKTIAFERNARDGTYNHVAYNFEPGRVTGFRYLRFIAEKPADGEETRYVEVDAFVSRVDPDQGRQTSIVTRHGTVLVGPIVRLDGTSAVVNWRRELAIPRPDLAGVRFYRMSEMEVLRVADGRRGALLDTRDFFEAELKGVEGGTIRLDSVLFGRRRFEAGREVLALFLAEIRPQGRWRVVLTDGSVLLIRSLKFDGEKVVMDDPCLGTVEVSRGQVVEISPGPDRMWTLAQPAVAPVTRPAVVPRLVDYSGDRVIAIPAGEERSFDVEPGARAFSARAGAAASADANSAVRLVVLVDGEVRYSSAAKSRRDASDAVLLPLKNARRIVLRVVPADGQVPPTPSSAGSARPATERQPPVRALAALAGNAKNPPEGLFADAVLVR